MFLHTTEGFPEYLSHWVFRICSCIQPKDFPSTWAIEFPEYVPAYNGKISRVSEPLKFQNMFLHTTDGFPEYLSHLSFRICSCIQQKDLPSVWATQFSKYVPAHSRRISRVSEPLNFQNMFLHTTERFPECLSHWIFKICSCIQQEDFPSIWTT